MAGKGISKEIKLIATLDDSAFKRQIADLKKSLGKDLTLGGVDLSDLRNSFKSIAKDFSKELKDALSSISKGSGRGSFSREARSMGGFDKEFIDEARQKAKQYRDENRHNDQLYAKEQREKIKQLDRENGARDKQLAKEAREKQRFLEKEHREKSRLDNTEVAKAMRSLGFKTTTSRAAAEAMQNAGSLGGVAQGAAATYNRLPLPRGIAAGMVGLGVLGQGLGVAADQVTDIRRLRAQRQQAQSLDILGGRGLEGAVRQSGRGFNLQSVGSGASKAALYGGIGAAAGSFLGPLGTVIGGAGGLALGAYKGFMEGGEKEAETRSMQVRPASIALERARSMRESRVAAMAGGGIGGAGLTSLQGQGAQLGFMPEQTLQQFMGARQFLGNRGAAQGLGALQNMNRRYGVDVEAGARSAEIFAGAGRTGMGAGVTSTIEVLKKGVASGLDASKAGQFLKMTADFVQNQTGFAQLNPEDIADRLARSAFQFARGGEVTQTQLQQSQNLQEMIRQASGTTEGLAGGANIMSVMEEAQKAGISLDPMQLLALSRSSNLGAGAIKSIAEETGAAPDQIEQFTKGLVNRKEQAPENIISMLFGKGETRPSRQAFGLTEGGFGNRTEDVLGIMQSRQFQGAMGPGKEPGMPAGAEMESMRVEATTSQTAFVAGLKLLGDDTKSVSTSLKTLNAEIDKAARLMKEYSGAVVRDKK